MQPTNPNQFTEKAWEAIARTPDIAKQAKNQHIESEHLMQSLLEGQGLANSIFKRAGVSVVNLADATRQFIEKTA